MDLHRRSRWGRWCRRKWRRHGEVTFILNEARSIGFGKAVVASTAVLHSTAQGEWCTFWIKGGTPKVIWHNGMTGGFNAFIGWYEGTQIGAFVLVNNHSEKDIATGIGMAVLEELKPK